jgi:hypothetical protein
VRVCRFLPEGLDAAAISGHLDDAELVGHGEGLADGGDGGVGAGRDVRGHHLLGIHPVDVIRAEYDDVVRGLVVDEVVALVDGVGGAGEPARAEALLRGHRRDVVAEQVRHAPGLGDVAVERVRLVLREHNDPQVVGVYEVGQREVDHAVHAAERDGRLRAVHGQRHEALAFPAGQHDGENLG